MTETKDIPALYTFLHSGTDEEKRVVLTSMIHAVDGTLDPAEQLEMIKLAQLAWQTVKSMGAHPLNDALVHSYTATVFYFNSLCKPGMYQLLPEPLRPWAHLGQRIGDAVEDNTPLEMHHTLRDAWCEVDTALLRQGHQGVNLLTMLQLFANTEYDPAEIRNNHWLLAMADYAVKAGYAQHVHEHLWGMMAPWFPEYQAYLEHCAAFDLSFAEVMAMMPGCTPIESAQPPQDMAVL